MSDQKDQVPNPPSQSTCVPMKKISFEETTPNYSSLDDPEFLRMNKKQRLEFLRKEAYFNVLHAFSKESPAISGPRIMIIRDLKKYWKIDHKTHTDYENIIKNDPELIQQFRDVSLASYEKEDQKAIAAAEQKPKNDGMLAIRDEVLAPAMIKDGKVLAPAKIQGEKAKLVSTTCEDSSVSGWGQVSPESLVGKWIDIRMPEGENDYIPFIIKHYDANTEMHHLVTVLSEKDFEDPCDWIDLRHIPAGDIKWREEPPEIPVRTSFLEPGQSLLIQTSTGREKKQLKESGKTSTGVPIITKVDKGKSILGAKSPN